MNGKRMDETHPENISRREILKLIGAGITTGLATIFQPSEKKLINQGFQNSKFTQNECDLPTKQNGFGKSPNIIFILSDNHNYKTMACVGHPFIQTPGLDRLAKGGVLYENAFCTTALCSPSRASILTGSYAHNHKILNNHTPWTGQMSTFLEYLSLYGYATAFIGKWHMPGKGLPNMPFLDLFVSYTYREGQGAYFNCPMIVNGEKVSSRKAYISEEITDYAIEFIQDNLTQQGESRRPFCIYLSHRSSHPPYQSPEAIAGMYQDCDVQSILPELIDPWWYGKSNRNIYQGVMMGSYYDQYRKYCETLTAMDADIVRLLDYLTQTGLIENTMIIYMGDNGMQWGTHDCHGIREPYEDSIRIPFILQAPWCTQKIGTCRSQMVLNIDIAPTILDIAGIPIPPIMDGESLLPSLTNPNIPGREEFILEFWRYFPENTPSYTGIRTQRYKYIEFERGRDPWLFDLQEDPYELKNLYNTTTATKILKTLLVNG
jgi:N-acetylglucosamine-6-sulfatase